MSLTLALLLVVAAPAFAQSDTPKKPLTEEALVKLIKGDYEEEVIVTLVKKRGVSFTVDTDVLDRLKQAGAGSAVLAAVRSADSDGENKVKVLATEKHENGLVVEVTEAKPDADHPLLIIRWHYRNPTKRTIQMFGEGPTFVVPARSDERWLFIHGIYFLSGGKDDEKQFRHSIVNDTGGKLWCKPISKETRPHRARRELRILGQVRPARPDDQENQPATGRRAAHGRHPRSVGEEIDTPDLPRGPHPRATHAHKSKLAPRSRLPLGNEGKGALRITN